MSVDRLVAVASKGLQWLGIGVFFPFRIVAGLVVCVGVLVVALVLGIVLTLFVLPGLVVARVWQGAKAGYHQSPQAPAPPSQPEQKKATELLRKPFANPWGLWN